MRTTIDLDEESALRLKRLGGRFGTYTKIATIRAALQVAEAAAMSDKIDIVLNTDADVMSAGRWRLEVK